MSPRSLLRLLAGTRALPPRAAGFQARAMLRAWRLGDDWALESSTRPRDVAELVRLARGRRTAGALVRAEPGRRLTSFDPVVRAHREAYLALLPRHARARLELVRAPGHEARGHGIDLLFVDSSHDRGATVAELEAWRPRLAP